MCMLAVRAAWLWADEFRVLGLLSLRRVRVCPARCYSVKVDRYVSPTVAPPTGPSCPSMDGWWQRHPAIPSQCAPVAASEHCVGLPHGCEMNILADKQKVVHVYGQYDMPVLNDVSTHEHGVVLP